MSINSLRIYSDALEISANVANLVGAWPEFHKKSLGSQIVRAADSIANNICEGYGRVSTGERVQFFMYADGSIAEVQSCLELAKGRGLIEREIIDLLNAGLRSLSIRLIEFAHKVIERDELYKGPFRERIERRRAWRKNRQR